MEVPRHWRLKKQRYALVGEVCPHCDAKIFPPRDVCPECGGEAKTAYAFSGKGEVYSFTRMSNAPAGFEAQAPYTVALVKLAEGPVVTAQLTDLGDEKGRRSGCRLRWSPASSAPTVTSAGCSFTATSSGR